MVRTSRNPYLALSEAGTYEIRWSDHGRSRRRATGTRDREQAEKILAHFIILKDRGELDVTPRPAAMLTSEILQAYRDEHVETKVASKETADFIITRLKAYFGAMAAQDITPQHIDSYITDRRTGKIGKRAKNSTIQRDLTVLRAAMNYAVKKRRIALSETPLIENLPQPPAKDRWLRRDEADTLLAAASMHYTAGAWGYEPDKPLPRVYVFIAIALATAARRGAILELQVDQIDLKQRRIHFNPAGRAQTNKRRVAVPISDWLWPIIKRAVAEGPSEGSLLGAAPIRAVFEGAVERAGLKGVTPHTLRHTWACWAAQAGVSLYEIAGVLGDSLTTVQNNYLHHCPDHLRGAVNFERRAA